MTKRCFTTSSLCSYASKYVSTALSVVCCKHDVNQGYSVTSRRLPCHIFTGVAKYFVMSNILT